MTLTNIENDEAGKVFVGGLSWETTKENLEKYFTQYGEVVDSVVIKNNMTGKSRGFGFITFRDPSSVSNVLANGPHLLDGKTIDPKACTPRGQNRGKSENMQKLFLGGLPPDVTETEIRTAFSKFGKVRDVTIMYDQEKRRSRGFGFLSFESEDSSQQACVQRYVDINGKQIECRLAVPRDSYRGSNVGGGGGGMGREHNSYQMDRSSMRENSSYSIAPQAIATRYGSNWAQQQPYTASSGMYGGASYGGGYTTSGYNSTYITPAPSSTASAPVASDPYGQASAYSSYGATQMPATAAPVSSGNYTTASATGFGSYSQENSNYSATKLYSTAGTAGGNVTYSTGYGYGSAVNNAVPQNKAYSQVGYHPYRR